VFSIKREKSCGVLLYRQMDGQRQYLVVKYAAGHWSLTKGHVENGETEQETARREVREETGIKGLRLTKGFRKQLSYSFTRNAEKVEKTVVFFLAKAQRKTVRLSFEHTDSAWLPAAKAVKKLTYPTDRQVVQAAQALLGI
jgi:8-oxo-dGTP pyrophosphatase MutT (NUDIX family)